MFYVFSPIFLAITLFCQTSFIVCKHLKSRNIDPRSRNPGVHTILILHPYWCSCYISEHYMHQLSVIVFGGHNNLFNLSILVINSVWAGLYLLYHYLNILKNTSNIIPKEKPNSSSYPIPTFIYIYCLALTGPSIFPYLKNPLVRTFAKKLIKGYITDIISSLSNLCTKCYSYKTNCSGKSIKNKIGSSSDHKSKLNQISIYNMWALTWILIYSNIITSSDDKKKYINYVLWKM